MKHLLICGTSTRAAAESAARAGFRVTAIDAFADLDQHTSVRALSTARDFGATPTASAIARAAARVDADAVVYLSPFENHPRAVTTLAASRALWGNAPETLRRVRDPFLLAAVLRRHGIAVPRLLSNHSNHSNLSNLSNHSNLSNLSNPSNPSNPSNGWLLKPFRSGGGHRIRRWRGERFSSASYLQERIDGTPGSIIFAAVNGACVPLGFSRQLVGDSNFGAHGYRYCGNILAPLPDPQFADGGALLEAARTLAHCVTSEFGLVGLNGIDFIARDGVPYPLEVNPRWSASVEVAENAFGSAFFPAHAEACGSGALPAFDCAAALRGTAAFGKAIVYARQSGSVGDTGTWLADPMVRDVPRRGELIRAGQPVCSVLATAADSQACYGALAERAARVYAALELGTTLRESAAIVG